MSTITSDHLAIGRACRVAGLSRSNKVASEARGIGRRHSPPHMSLIKDQPTGSVLKRLQTRLVANWADAAQCLTR